MNNNQPGPTAEETRNSIEDVFSYHAPEPDQIPKYEAIRAGAKSFALLLANHLPQSADRTAAIRKLRECVMTANAAIALNGRGVR